MPHIYPQNCPFSFYDHPHLIHPSLDRPQSPPQTASRSNQLFFHNSCTGHTYRQTDRWDRQQACSNTHLRSNSKKFHCSWLMKKFIRHALGKWKFTTPSFTNTCHQMSTYKRNVQNFTQKFICIIQLCYSTKRLTSIIFKSILPDIPKSGHNTAKWLHQ